jgi:hypothetical protein
MNTIQNAIGGKLVTSVSTRTQPVFNPATGEAIATLPLAPAAKNYAVTELPAATIARRTGAHDLCFMFTQATVDPLWVLDAVQLVGLAVAGSDAHPATVAANE